jgi:hypothetical protein
MSCSVRLHPVRGTKERLDAEFVDDLSTFFGEFQMRNLLFGLTLPALEGHDRVLLVVLILTESAGTDCQDTGASAAASRIKIRSILTT